MYLFELFVLFSYIYPTVELLGNMVVPFLVSWESSILSTVVALIYIPTNSVKVFPFIYVITRMCYFYRFNDIHSESLGMISHCGFYLYFSAGSWCLASFLVPVWPKYLLVKGFLIQSFTWRTWHINQNCFALRSKKSYSLTFLRYLWNEW